MQDMSLSYAHPVVNLGQQAIYQGWLLKKRRKKMQGFARRYFILYRSGALSYSISPKHPARDQILVPEAALSTVTGRRDIHIDSCNATFHIKCLTMEDFDGWMTALRKFIPTDGRKSTVVAKATPKPNSSQWNRSSFLLDAMGSTITELEEAVAVFQSSGSVTKSGSAKSKGDKEKHSHNKDGMFSLFKRSHHEDGMLSRPPADSPLQAHFKHINEILESLRSQHAALLESFTATQGDVVTPTARAFHAHTTADEKLEQTTISRFRSFRRSTRAASVSSTSDGIPIEWFDAQDNVGEEFVLDVATPDDERAQLTLQTGSTNHQEYDSASSNEAEEVIQIISNSEPASSVQSREIVRRSRLPCGTVGDEGSLFTILKKNVGKDLSTITFPVSFNEPLTLLQRAAEEVEYYELLQQAVDSKDWIEQMCFVAAFAVSGYSHTRHRTGRKGFNPMLAETFEDVRMKFIAEKVSHNPVIIAYHAEGHGWQLDATSAGKTKFWGKSLEIIPLGTTRLKIGQDHYEWNKPSSFIRNLMMGTKYLEHCGNMTIRNHDSGASCVIEFKQAGYWGASNEVVGTVLSASGEVCARIEGKWDEQVALALDPSHLRVLWRITPFPKQAVDYYGFTAFAITLNETTSDLQGKLPPTDSRYRPDVRALEEGHIDLAEEQKAQLEELQRERRRRGADRSPRWFKMVGEDWVYTGEYWQARDKGWSDSPVEPLW